MPALRYTTTSLRTVPTYIHTYIHISYTSRRTECTGRLERLALHVRSCREGTAIVPQPSRDHGQCLPAAAMASKPCIGVPSYTIHGTIRIWKRGGSSQIISFPGSASNGVLQSRVLLRLTCSSNLCSGLGGGTSFGRREHPCVQRSW